MGRLRHSISARKLEFALSGFMINPDIPSGSEDHCGAVMISRVFLMEAALDSEENQGEAFSDLQIRA